MPFLLIFISYNILHPHITLQHKETDHHLNDFRKLYQKEYSGDRKCGMSCQERGKGNDQQPGIYTVKQKGDDRFATGAEGKVGTV